MEKFNKKYVLSGFLLIIVLVNIPQLSIYYSTKTQDDWRAAGTYLKDAASPGDTILIMPGYNSGPFQFYYNNSSFGTIELFASNRKDLEFIVSNLNTTNHSMFILYTNDLSAVDPNREILPWINNNSASLDNFNGVFIRKYYNYRF